MAIRDYEHNGKKLFEVYVNGTDSRGRRIQRKRCGFESRRKAEAAEFELMREMAKLKEEKVPYRWGEWLEICLKRMKMTYQVSTIINYETTLGKWVNTTWQNLEISEIGREQVYSMIFENVDPALKPNSRKCILKYVKRIFQMAVEDGVLVKNPCVGIRVRVPEVDQKVLTAREVEILLNEARQMNHRFYPVWVLAVMTGMRSGELFALRWTDLDLDAKLISVSRQWTSKNGFTPTKTRKSRVVPISDDLLVFLKERKLAFEAESEFVLPHLQEWAHGEQAKVLKEFCQAFGITPIKFHDLRATFITNLLARGASLARVMTIVGHTELKTTNIYLRKAGVDVQGVTDGLGYKVPRSEKANVLSIAGRERG